MPTGIVDVKIAMEADTTFPSLEKKILIHMMRH